MAQHLKPAPSHELPNTFLLPGCVNQGYPALHQSLHSSWVFKEIWLTPMRRLNLSRLPACKAACACKVRWFSKNSMASPFETTFRPLSGYCYCQRDLVQLQGMIDSYGLAFFNSFFTLSTAFIVLVNPPQLTTLVGIIIALTTLSRGSSGQQVTSWVLCLGKYLSPGPHTDGKLVHTPE